MEYPFIAITLWSTLARTSSTSFYIKYETELSKNYSYSIRPRNKTQKKKTLKKQLHKNVNMNLKGAWFPSL